VQRKEIELTRGGKTERLETAGFDGVEKELIALAESIRSGTAHRNSPNEAFADLAVVEAILDSAAKGCPVQPAIV
jgi:predicted dehydrogenase